MILSTSNKKQHVIHGIQIYLGSTIFCTLFSVIYEAFSHEVYSNFMIYLALIPLIGGLLPFLLLRLTNLPYPARLSLNAYNSGIATLTVGCCLKGVFEIYGSSCPQITVYWITGAALVFLGLLTYGITCAASSRTS